jgi:opacity protein-like surface antigen
MKLNKYLSHQLIQPIQIHFITAAIFLICVSSLSRAQDERGFTVHAGIGATPLTGDISKRLDNGWHGTVGAGYNFSSFFAASIDYTYHGLGVGKGVLAEAQVPDGDARLWSVTANPRLRLHAKGKVDPYLVGGVGYYRRTVEFTQPALVPVFFFDPFFGIFFNTLLPANQVIGRIRQGGVGGSLGGGLDWKLPGDKLKFYAEVRYHYADTGRIPTRMIPVTLGLRW